MALIQVSGAAEPAAVEKLLHQSSTDTTHAHHSSQLGWVTYGVTRMLDEQVIESAGRFAHY